jgi:hypothetical protein
MNFTLPPEFSVTPNFPDMRIAVEGEPEFKLCDLWQASIKIQDVCWVLEVRWIPPRKQFFCQMVRYRAEPQWKAWLDYPHEVMGWIGQAIQKLQAQRTQE